MSYIIVIYFTKCDEGVTSVTVTVTQSCDTENIIKNSRIDNIIQYIIMYYVVATTRHKVQ